MITRGFGTTYDLETCRARAWYFRDGVRRWADDDTPCEPESDAQEDTGAEGR